MKKIYTIGIVIAVIAAFIPTLVLADSSMNNETTGYTDDYPFDEEEFIVTEESDEDTIDEAYDDDSTSPPLPTMNPTDDGGQKALKVRGKWGVGKDREPDGYWGGIITSRQGEQGIRIGVFKGAYNISGEEERHRIVGIMKKGYFNGKLINDDGSEVKITGLYKVDREHHLLKMQWMVPKHAGWAVARLSIVEI